MSAPENREAWLTQAADIFTTWFGVEIPPFRVSVGWPGGRSKKSITRGQCWPTTSAEDGVAQVFISPGWADSETILAVLLHEMVHVADDCQSGHKKGFSAIAKPLGFTPKWTSSDNRTDELSERLRGVIEQIGEFPSAAIVQGVAADTPKKQSTRMLKVTCPCGYTVRTSQKWIDVGLPTCACGTEMDVA